MNLYSKLTTGEEKISVTGLGYVGLTIAVAFSRKVNVIGFDLNDEKIAQYRNGIDSTKEVGDDAVRACSVDFTTDERKLKEARFHIIAVPTPVHNDDSPDLSMLVSASRTVGRNLVPGAIVVYESTVYPGVTEEICVPILEEASGMKCGKDFKVGYSPERINPGDKVHRLENIVKIVSGMDAASLEEIAKVYELVVEAGVYRAESIRVAEAAKVIENSQRDINIAFMNELSVMFHKMGIDTQSVLKAAETKWNFLKFTPGLVGGHCIAVDPYYLTYKAEQMGYHSQVILSGRKINDNMGKYVAESTVKQMIRSGISLQNAKAGILGVTFKENCPDIKNTKIVDIYRELQAYGITTVVTDPVADAEEVKRLYGMELVTEEDLRDCDCVILAVAHNAFRFLSEADIGRMFRRENTAPRVLIDVKGILDRKEYEMAGYCYWRL